VATFRCTCGYQGAGQQDLDEHIVEMTSLHGVNDSDPHFQT
jgi:hypothetical protein